MLRAGADRGSLLIAFGGGIVGDVGGFVAAIFMRGIPYVQVPTTFLAQVDSSVGGKTGVNLPEGKNLVGSFHQPRAVFADIAVLGTLPVRELKAGLMESVKAGIIRDRSLVRYMEENASAIIGRDARALEKVIAASIRMKADVVSRDERESGLRMILNLGHTVGHAIEQATAYKLLLHGEAVAWGMIAALYIARMRGTITAAQHERLERLIHLYGPFPALKLRPAKVIAATGADKKNVGGVRRFVLPVGIGDAGVVEDVSPAELEAAVRYMLEQAKALTPLKSTAASCSSATACNLPSAAAANQIESWRIQLSDNTVSLRLLGLADELGYSGEALDCPHTSYMRRTFLFAFVLLVVSASSAIASTAGSTQAHRKASAHARSSSAQSSPQTTLQAHQYAPAHQG